MGNVCSKKKKRYWKSKVKQFLKKKVPDSVGMLVGACRLKEIEHFAYVQTLQTHWGNTTECNHWRNNIPPPDSHTLLFLEELQHHSGPPGSRMTVHVSKRHDGA